MLLHPQAEGLNVNKCQQEGGCKRGVEVRGYRTTWPQGLGWPPRLAESCTTRTSRYQGRFSSRRGNKGARSTTAAGRSFRSQQRTYFCLPDG
jgi:hypothetical protein